MDVLGARSRRTSAVVDRTSPPGTRHHHTWSEGGLRVSGLSVGSRRGGKCNTSQGCSCRAGRRARESPLRRTREIEGHGRRQSRGRERGERGRGAAGTASHTNLLATPSPTHARSLRNHSKQVLVPPPKARAPPARVKMHKKYCFASQGSDPHGHKNGWI